MQANQLTKPECVTTEEWSLRFRARNGSVSATSVTSLQSAEGAVKHPSAYIIFAEGYKKDKLSKK